MIRGTCTVVALLVATMAFGQATEWDSPTTLSLTANERPLAEALRSFEQSTGVAVAVDSNIPSEAELLAKPIRIDVLDRPFWEVVAAIEDAAELQLKAIQPGRVVLKPRSPAMAFVREATGERQPAAPISSGAFFVTPTIVPGDPLKLVVRPEPRAAAARVLNFHTDLTFADGTKATYQPTRLLWVYELSGEMTLRVDEDLLREQKTIRQLDLQAELEVPGEWRTLTLPPIASLAPRMVTIGDGRIRVERAGLEEEPDPRHTEVGLYLHADAVMFADLKRREQFALVAPDGTRALPFKVGSSKGESDDAAWQTFDLGFRPNEVPGDLRDYRLAIRTDEDNEEVIGPLRDIRPQPVRAGKANVSFDCVNLRTGEIELSVYNFALSRERMRLDVGNGTLLEPVGWVQSGTFYPHSYSLTFETGDVPSDPATWRLVLTAPTTAMRHSLRATFENLRIAE